MGKKDAPQRNPEREAAAVSGLNQETNVRNLKQNSQNIYGPAGGTEFQFDANGLPTSRTASLNPALQPAFGSAASNLGAQAGAMPTSVNYDSTTPGNILSAGMQTYDALAQDPIRQGQGRISQEIANRGLPINDQISQDLQGNFDRQNGLARQSAFSTLYGQLPGLQSTMTDTANKQAMAPGALAGQSLGLLSGLTGLVPQASQPVSAEGSAGPTYSKAVEDNYQAQLAQYNANQQGLGNLLKMGAGIAFSPATGVGSLGNTLIGKGLGGLFNSA